MPIVPVRGLATLGILHDPSAYDLPPTAWSGGSNVRFDGTQAMRAPIWRDVCGPLSFTPAFCVGDQVSTGYDLIYLLDTAGYYWQVNDAVVTNVTPTTGYTAIPNTSQPTSCSSGDVLFINNPSTMPVYFGPVSTAFAVMPNWNSTWRCGALRAYKDYLVALNVTKAGVQYPTMVKTSDNIILGAPPPSWDATDSTKNTTENVLADLTTPLIDGCVMHDAMILYSSNQIWSMQAVASAEVFSYDRLFTEGGVIAPNCVAEVDGIHYVFGFNDIYKHDGTTKVSLLNKRNRRYIFGNLNVKLAGRCHVLYMPHQGDIKFNYVSGDNDAYFKGPTGCNKSALYNIASDTWSFEDCPNVTAMSIANLNYIWEWGNTPAGSPVPLLTWDNCGGSWYDQIDSYNENIIGCAQTLPGFTTSNKLLAYDFLDTGNVNYPFSPECNAPAYLERIGIDLQEEGAPIQSYKKIRRIFPQATTVRPALTPTVQVGASITAGSAINWGPVNSFNPQTDYKVDVRVGGRYLAYRFSVSAPGDFSVTGFDVDVTSGGTR
jgi:hypothetical protein